MKEQSIFWFQDDVKLKSPAHQWERINMLTIELIDLIGHPGFNHFIVDPMKSLHPLRSKLDIGPSNTVIDLTGSIGQRETDNFPNIPMIGRFRLSRVRNVSSSRLDGVGFIVTMTPDEIDQLKSQVDLSNPILIDDVAWSGRTALEAINILGLNPTNTVFGALALNVGNFGEGKPGAAELLEKTGLRVVGGDLVETPKHDGFHLADFFDNPMIIQPDIFDVVIHIQKLREETVTADDARRKVIDQEIKNLLSDNIQGLFANAKSTEEMTALQAEGRLVINGGLSKNAFFDVNPPNWLMPSFSRRVRSEMLIERRDKIINVLKNLGDIALLRRFL